MPDIEIVGVASLEELVATLNGDEEPPGLPDEEPEIDEPVPDFADVRGHNGLIPGPRGRRGGRPQPVPAGPARAPARR